MRTYCSMSNDINMGRFIRSIRNSRSCRLTVKTYSKPLFTKAIICTPPTYEYGCCISRGYNTARNYICFVVTGEEDRARSMLGCLLVLSSAGGRALCCHGLHVDTIGNFLWSPTLPDSRFNFLNGLINCLLESAIYPFLRLMVCRSAPRSFSNPKALN